MLAVSADSLRYCCYHTTYCSAAGSSDSSIAAAAALAKAAEGVLTPAVAAAAAADETWAFGRDSVIAAIEAVAQGKLVVVTDDEDRCVLLCLL
jgi:hypothetical protein